MLEQVVKLYFEDKLSLKAIATKLGTYTLKLKRLLNDAGYRLRDKSESQKVALDAGRATHPTKGRQRRPEIKKKIGQSMHKVWQNRPKEMVDELKERCKKRIESQTDEERAAYDKKRKEGLCNAGVVGSKIEKYIVRQLSLNGYKPKFRFRGLAFLEKPVDIFIPGDKIVVEIDGPVHCYPERFPKMEVFRLKEQQKNQVLIQAGYHVLRVRIKNKSITIPYKEKIWQNVQNQIERLLLETTSKLVFLEIEK